MGISILPHPMSFLQAVCQPHPKELHLLVYPHFSLDEFHFSVVLDDS
uniref:Uncharacterized protein n=1 Tax=Anguilla anguilla TaxID=7936 RepID=A0A0E9PFQ3_ANGAN